MGVIDGTLRALGKTLTWLVILGILVIGVVAVAIVVFTGSDEVIVDHFKNNARHRP